MLSTIPVRRIAVCVIVVALLAGATGGVVAQQAGNATNATAANAANTTTATPNGSPKQKVQTVIRKFNQSKEIPWGDTTPKERRHVRELLMKMATSKLSIEEQGPVMTEIKHTILYDDTVLGIPMSTNPEAVYQIEKIIQNVMNVKGGLPGYGTPQNGTTPIWEKWDIPSLVDVKLKSLGDAFMQSVPKALKTAYKGIWSTPVPINSGWHGLLGRPTNFPFQPIHANLLQKYIYPLMSKLLGIGLILIAGAILVNPLSSTYRAKDLFINFVTGVTLYAFSWLVMTTMHAVTDMAIRFIIPNPSKLTQSMDNLLSLGGAPVALYLFGSGGLFSTLFSLGLEFWLRHVLLAYLLPYLFGALMLIAWVAPHGRLRKFASMGLWQYVNVLLWPIIPAIIFRAIIAVNWNFRVGEGGVIAVFVLITLFLCMIAIPIAQTWFFLQVPGAVHARVQSNVDAAQEKMESAASRVPNPLPSMSDIKDSATAAMATDGGSPGNRAADMINAADISTNPTRSLSSSGTLDSSLSDDASTSSGWSRLRGDTTASKIRSLHQQNREGSMTAEAMKAEYFDRSMDNRMMTDGGTEAVNHSRHITNL